MTIAELGIQNGDIITARRISVKEQIGIMPVVDPETDWLCDRAVDIFSEWYDLYKNEISGKMDNYSVAKFCSRATNSTILSTEPKVASMIQEYDSDNDGMLDLEDFLRFYYDAGVGTLDKQQAI